MFKRAVLLIAIIASFWFAWGKLRPAPDYSSTTPHRGIVISHKTAGLEFPENAEAGFQASLGMAQVNGIEIDVHVVKGGDVVLHHDPVLSNYNCFDESDNATRLIVAQQTAEDLAALDCLNHKVKKGESLPYRIAPLARFLQLYRQSDQSKRIFLEIKVWDQLIENNPRNKGLNTAAMHYPDAEVARAVLAVLRDFPEVTNIQFNSFGRGLLLELRAQMRPDETYDFGLLYKGHYSPWTMGLPALLSFRHCYDFCWVPDYAEVRQWMDANQITTFIPHFGQATALPFRRSFQRYIMDDKGALKVLPWTLNTPKDWARYQDQDFDGILTDAPTAFLAWVQE